MPPEIQAIPDEKIVTLGEGNTPFIRARNLEEFLKSQNKFFAAEVWLKLEGKNPSGSFKDRGMTGALSFEKSRGTEAIICASTGNTSASAAAYAARAGIKSYVLLPEGKVAIGKLLQAYAFGAKAIQIRGNFDQALVLAKQIKGMELVNNSHPYRLCGQATAAYEICDELERNPSYHFLPVGNAGNITAYWRGYKEYCRRGKIKFLPAMFGYQAAGAAPIVLNKVVENPETIASAIRIGNPTRWEEAKAARDESYGRIDSVTDEEILEAYQLLCRSEGVFCEPSSATSVAGLIKTVRLSQRHFWEVTIVACTLTGDGSKDPATAQKVFAKDDKPTVVDATFEAVMDVIGSE